jgi:hypothetical protein
MNMRFNLLHICLLIALACSCKKEVKIIGNPGDLIDLSKPVDSATLRRYHYDTITFKPIDLGAIRLIAGSVWVAASVGGDVRWMASVDMYDSANRAKRVSFSVQDFHNSRDSLFQKGLHAATGQVNDAISNYLQIDGFTLNTLSSDEFEIFFENVGVNPDNSLSAAGFIQIKKKIYWKWPAGIWTGAKYIYPGDPDYLDYCIPVYYVPCKIYFDTMGK